MFFLETNTSIFPFLVFQDKVSLCNPGWPGTCSLDLSSVCLCLLNAGIKSVRHQQLILDFCFVLFCFVFRDRVSLCSPGCLGTHSVDQAGLDLRDLPASASLMLGLKACVQCALPAETLPLPPPPLLALTLLFFVLFFF